MFASLSHAHLVRRRLSGRVQPLELTRTPQCYSTKGCSFALRCKEADVELLRAEAERAGLPWRGDFADISDDFLRAASLYDDNVDER